MLSIYEKVKVLSSDRPTAANEGVARVRSISAQSGSRAGATAGL